MSLISAQFVSLFSFEMLLNVIEEITSMLHNINLNFFGNWKSHLWLDGLFLLRENVRVTKIQENEKIVWIPRELYDSMN